jgi:hypothetical protein
MSIIGQTAIMHIDTDEKAKTKGIVGVKGERRGVGGDYNSSAIELRVTAAAGGSVLHITSKKPTQNHGNGSKTVVNNEVPSKRDLSVVISLQSLCISLIAERPVRREFASLYMDEIECKFLQKQTVVKDLNSVVSSYGLEVADMQIDNYSETAIFPVLMHSYNASQRERNKTARRRKRAIRLRKGSVDMCICNVYSYEYMYICIELEMDIH